MSADSWVPVVSVAASALATGLAALTFRRSVHTLTVRRRALAANVAGHARATSEGEKRVAGFEVIFEDGERLHLGAGPETQDIADGVIRRHGSS